MKIKKCYWCLILLMTFVLNSVTAQAVLLYEDVSADSVSPIRGPNRPHFVHIYFNFGFLVDKSEKGALVEYGKSNHFDIGWRYKRKISGFYSVGTDLAICYYGYRMKQDLDKILPDTILHDKESFNLNLLSLGVYNRFNFGKRGNHIGNFIDVGVHGQRHFSLKHFTQNEMPNGNVVSVTTSELKYYEKWGWGLNARLGFNRWVFSANYRMSNLFKENDNFPELPRLSIGLQVGVH